MFPRIWEEDKTSVASWDGMMIDKQNMEKVPLVQDQWKIVLPQCHIHLHHGLPLVGIRMPFSEVPFWCGEDHIGELHPTGGFKMSQR